MAGFSIILLMMLFCWPAVLLLMVVYLVAAAAAEFVMSPAFPCRLVSMACGTFAAIDVVRVLWRHHKEKDACPLTKGLFVRPGVFALLSAAFFVAMIVICGSMLLTWVQSTQS